MIRPVFAPLLALPLAAQGALFQEDTTMPPTVGVNIQAGFPLDAAAKDLNRGAGYGASVSYLWHLGGRHILRPNLEYNGYRVSPPRVPAWATGTGQRPILHTWKVGVDYLMYQEPWAYRGPYALVGVGLQYSEIDHQVQNGAQLTLADHRSTLSSPWVGAGAGYQITPDIAFEVRYSVAAYTAQRGQPLASYVLTESTRRDGRFLHIVLALRVPL